MTAKPRASAGSLRSAADAAAQRDPSWFLDAANDQPQDLLAAHYRRTLGSGGQPLPRHGQHDTDMARRYPVEARPAARMAMRQSRDDGSGRQHPAQPARPRRRTGLYAALVTAAVLTGGAAGYVASNHDAISREARLLLGLELPASPVTQAAVTQTAAPATVITRKPIAMATLHVADVEGEVNSLIDLPLRLEQGELQPSLQLKIAGLPETAYLTAGQRNAARVWTLEAKDLDGLKLMVPDMGLPRIDLAVSAVEPATGELLAPAKVMTVALTEARIEPAAAPPPTALPPKPQAPTQLSAIPAPTSTGVELPGAATLNTMSAADALLAAGDAEAARELYQAALDAGAAEAALGMGRSFDPLVHAQYKVNRGKPDSAAAVKWYERAAQAGQADAFQAIVRLKVRP